MWFVLYRGRSSSTLFLRLLSVKLPQLVDSDTLNARIIFTDLFLFTSSESFFFILLIYQKTTFIPVLCSQNTLFFNFSHSVVPDPKNA